MFSDPVLIAAIGAIASIVTLVVKDCLKTRHKKRENSFTNVFPQVHKVYSILNDLKSASEANRILVLKAENGGGKPQVGCILKSSVIYEVYDSPLRSVKRAWQKQPLDDQYTKILADLIVSPTKFLQIITSDMKEGGMLTDVYAATNVKKTCLHELSERNTEYLYLSITYDNDKPMTVEEKYRQMVAVNELKQLFSNYKEL